MWDRIEPLMPADPIRGRRWADHRRTLEAIAWKYRTCSPWRDLPDELGSFQTAHKRLIRWGVDGTWERILAAVLAAADADDVNQTVWLRLVEHLDTLREPKALPGWLATTARNEGLRAIRRKARDLPVDPEGGVLDRGEQHDLDEAIVQDLRSHALREAMQELPENRRELLYLLLADPPLSYDEISARLGIPKGSIGPTRARALEQLRSSRALSGWLTDEPAHQGGDRDAVLD